MALFSFGKNKDKQTGCSCGGACENQDCANHAKPNDAPIKVLGSGCAKCNELEANTKAALAQLGIDAAIDHVTDFSQIAAYGVMSTPALVVNGKVLVYGKVLNTEELVKLLQNQNF